MTVYAKSYFVIDDAFKEMKFRKFKIKLYEHTENQNN